MAQGNWWESFPTDEGKPAEGEKWWEAYAPVNPPKPAAKKSGGVGDFFSDLGKRAAGAVVSGVASIPEAIQSGLRAGVRSGAGGDPATVMPGGAFIPGVDTDEAINGQMTERQLDRRELQGMLTNRPA